jgi:hypothetical protein
MISLQKKYKICDDIMDYIYFIIFDENYKEVKKQFHKFMDIEFLINCEIYIFDFV